MVIYTGSYLDAGLNDLAAFEPKLEFILSQEAFTISGGRLLSTRPVVVQPGTDGAFTVDLVSNDSIQGNTTYLVRATYLDAAANYVAVDLFSIYARRGGGSLSEMATTLLHFRTPYVISSPTTPDPWPPAWVWFNPVTGDLNRKV